MANDASSTAKKIVSTDSQPDTSRDATTGASAQSTTVASASHRGSRNTAVAAT